MSEILLAVFDETLDDLSKRMKVLQGIMRRLQGEIEERQKDLKEEDSRWACALYEEEQVTKKIDALKDHLRRLGKHPDALLNKAKILGDEQQDKARAAKVMEERIEGISHDLQTKKTKLAVTEREYADLQRQWNEVSDLATQERARAAA